LVRTRRPARATRARKRSREQRVGDAVAVLTLSALRPFARGRMRPIDSLRQRQQARPHGELNHSLPRRDT